MTRTITTKNRIPAFASVEEEAAFWDTPSTADYEDEFTPVRVRFARRLSEGLSICLGPATLAQVRAETQERGIGATTLIRMWVLEHVKEHRKRST
jgi:hypothetical protein